MFQTENRKGVGVHVWFQFSQSINSLMVVWQKQSVEQKNKINTINTMYLKTPASSETAVAFWS